MKVTVSNLSFRARCELADNRRAYVASFRQQAADFRANAAEQDNPTAKDAFLRLAQRSADYADELSNAR